MYQRLNYSDQNVNMVCQSITSTDLYRYQSQFNIQISDFLHYEYRDQKQKYYDEFIIVIYGMSSQKIQINKYQSLQFQRQNQNRYRNGRENKTRLNSTIRIQKQLLAYNNIDYQDV